MWRFRPLLLRRHEPGSYATQDVTELFGPAAPFVMVGLHGSNHGGIGVQEVGYVSQGGDARVRAL